MGGFAAAIGDIVESGASKLSTKFGPEAREMLYRGFLSDKSVMEATHSAAKELFKIHQQQYEPLVDQLEKKAAVASKSNTPFVHKGAPVKSPEEITRYAHETAYNTVYGEHGQVIQSVLKKVQLDKGQMAADNLTDTFHIIFKQEQPTGGMTKFQRDMKYVPKGVEKENSNALTVANSTYKGQAGYEQAVNKFNKVLAYKAAIIHAAVAPLNIAIADGGTALIRGMVDIWGPSRQGTINSILHSNQLSELVLNDMKEDTAFQNSWIHKFAPGSAGEFIHRNMYMPGMSSVRRQSLLLGAAVAKNGLEDAVMMLKHGDKKAVDLLQDLGIDAKDVINNNFQINQGMLDKAFYHGTNRSVFLHPYDSTPSIWRQSPLFRSAKTFTGYITKEYVFIRQTLMRQVQRGDYVGVARTLGTLALAFPLVGSLLTEMDRLAIGDDADDPKKHLQNRLEATPAGALALALAGKKNDENTATLMENTIDMMAKMGAVGGIAGYIKGANRGSLIQDMAPPYAREGAELIQDSLHAASGDKNHPESAKPLERDALRDAIPILGIGSILSHKLVPTKKELAAKKFHKFSARRSKPKSNNPLQFSQSSF